MSDEEFYALLGTIVDVDGQSVSLFEHLFPASNHRMVYVKNSGMPYEENPNFMKRGLAGGVVFVNESQGYSILVSAHEIGHQLLPGIPGDGHRHPPYPAGVVGNNPHGIAPVYPGVPHNPDPNWAIMQAGEPVGFEGNTFLPWIHGRWLQFEDWREANEEAME